MLQPGEWAWSLEHQQVRVAETQDLWGDTLYRVWVPAKDATVRVRASQLRPRLRREAWLTYLTAVAHMIEHRVQEVLEEKLALTLEEFGVDKTGDILDSAPGRSAFRRPNMSRPYCAPRRSARRSNPS